MAATTVQNPGQVNNAGDRLALFLKVFAGEVLTAFARTAKSMDKHIVRTIQSGKSASFPVMGRTVGKYLAPGNSLDDQRAAIPHNEKIIAIDGLLTADVLITDIDDAMNHYDVRGEYSKQLGEALALAADGSVLAELAALSAVAENLPGLGAGAQIQLKTATSVAVADPTVGQEILASLAQARMVLGKKYVPSADRAFFVTPEAYSSILAALMPQSSNYHAIIDPETGNLRNIHGFEIIEVPHFELGGADGKHAFPVGLAGKVVGLAMHRSAVGTVKLKDLALERARRPEFQADQIIAKYAMGHGGLRPEAVVAVLVKSV
ncbi:putative major capsid protein [Ralstonia phage 10RS306A]|uniref:Major capsid protein n=1 Tax=Ralstonia phage 10RS306A TaxID=2968818 RepID=A0A977XPW8_9CAUD|nr:putative major capsid protein [Ralstonia phage 10RS306A]UYE93705.1 putative major capsid protein [Ralstonia phage 10RS305A]